MSQGKGQPGSPIYPSGTNVTPLCPYIELIYLPDKGVSNGQSCQAAEIPICGP